MAAHHPPSALCTDLYELTMAAGYLQTGFAATATFQLFSESVQIDWCSTLPTRISQVVSEGRRFIL